MHYQPIFNNFTEKIEKYEALIRLKYKDEYIFPDEFLPIAKELNKYQTLTYMVINKSFSFFQDKDYEFSINISMLDIENENFIDFLFERIQYYNVSKKLVLEIVESESVEDYDSFYKFIKSVKSIGCKVAIDDFGSGYSNFEHLLNLSDHIDYLKIDGSLVKNITTDSKIQILIGSLKFLCDNLRLKTIAEYVEDTKTLEYINSIGIDYSQGYLIGKPSKDLI
jgi:EAL domain-containing protein (putative c-di-GMP-specific phosphodiesterase class I)